MKAFFNMFLNFDNSIFDHFPVIDLGGVVLRNIYLENDYQKYYKYITSPHVTKYLAKRNIPTSPETAKSELGYWARLFDARSCVYWAIAIKSTNEMIGTCGFNYWNRDQKRAEISYDLDHDYWGRGIMTESVRAVSNFGLQTMKVQRIQATVASDNIASMKVLEKCGYYQESLMKKFGVLHEEVKDFYMYVIL